MTDPTELRARRRALAKELHPDRGGDPDHFVAALAALERDASREAPTGARRRRERVRALRAALPRHVPGARRYATY